MTSGRNLLFVPISDIMATYLFLTALFLQLPNQVYRFDPKTSQLRVVADGFDKCNGIAFSPDGSVAYV